MILQSQEYRIVMPSVGCWDLMEDARVASWWGEVEIWWVSRNA